MHPIVFGNSTRPLFGVLHPAMGKASDVGVVLLHPGVHEYERAHWAFRTLASALAARGRHVLRFDYRGTGDSAGEPDETTIEACVDDAQAAWLEMKEVPGVRRVSFVGMRLGAAVGAIAARSMSVDDLVLWEPVVRGRRYVEELELLDASMRLRLLLPRRRPEGEIAGFAFPAAVRASIERVDLAKTSGVQARRVLLFASAVDRDLAELRDGFVRAGLRVEVNATGDEGAIVRASARQAAVVPGSTVTEIATHIEGSRGSGSVVALSVTT